MIDSFVTRKYKQISKIIKPGSVVLDVGCEDGSLRDFIKPSSYTGVDIEKENIENLKKQNIKAFLLDLNTYKKLPFKEKYDYIFLLDVLEHTLNPAKVINDFKQFLKGGGKFIISLPNDYHILNKIRFLLNKNITEFPFWEHGHLHTFPISEGKKFLEKQGLKIIEMEYIAPKTKIPMMNSLAKLFPNNFARIVVYKLSI